MDTFIAQFLVSLFLNTNVLVFLMYIFSYLKILIKLQNTPP